MRRSPILALAFTLMAAAASAEPGGDAAARLVDAALASDGAWRVAAHLTDRIGPRLSGSPGAAAAVAWTAETLRSWGLDTRLEPVTVPRWVRGVERGRIVAPVEQNLVLTALGGSGATPAGGVTAPVVRVSSYEELEALGEAVRGKIVFYDARMDPELVAAGRAFEAYSSAVVFRGTGAIEASKRGAVASVIRSVASHSLRTPHTGAMRPWGETAPIPAAALTVEDADLLARLLSAGEEVRLHLELTPRELPPVESANVVAEIRGRELPDEVVLIGGHLDSWDLGTGAIDNASGVAMTMETMRLIRRLGLAPRRTIRAVLFMNEENGLGGARAYAAAHPAAEHFAALEADAGVGAPGGFVTTLEGDKLRDLLPRLAVLARIGANRLEHSPVTGADTSLLVRQGVTGFGVFPDSRLYFAYHHSPADTLDKIDPEHLRQNAAAMAVLTWVLAEMEGRL